MDRKWRRLWCSIAALVLAGALLPGAARAQKADPDGYTVEDYRAMLPEYFNPQGGQSVSAVPDIFGPGAVLTVGNLFMKIANIGYDGNPLTQLSSDPGGQWKGSSGIEYLSSIRLYVAAKNPTADNPVNLRRVSYLFEWRPPSLDPEDRIYQAYDGIQNGFRFVNDDNDFDQDGNPRVDEDFLDGRDNDNDGRVDEDYGAIGQQMFSLVMTDNTREAINATFNEKHVPLGLRVEHRAFAFSVPGFLDFNGLEHDIKNISGRELDSVYVGFLLDMDAGPVERGNYYADDFDLPYFPQDSFYVAVEQTDPKYQGPPVFQHNARGVHPDSALCPVDAYVVHGFSVGDDDGDENMTLGLPSFLLLGHTIDPTGKRAPPFKRWRAFRSFPFGTPYQNGGLPIVDQQRYEFLSSTQNVDEATGFITALRGDQKGDQAQIVSVGPFLNVQPNQVINVATAFAIQEGRLAEMDAYTRKPAGARREPPLPPCVENALTCQFAYNGIWEQRVVGNLPNTDFHGRETPLKASPGQILFANDCRDQTNQRQVSQITFTWFDFDCNYCTGVWSPQFGGYFHKIWNASAPPPNPKMNVHANFNYRANPGRQGLEPSGDREIVVAWDNLSERTADPKTNMFDFYAYKLWKAANWTRPVGSSGPGENDWSLIGEFVRFDHADTHCVNLYIPQQGVTKNICMARGDLVDYQSGRVLKPNRNLDCVRDTSGNCFRTIALKHGTTRGETEEVIHYPVGRYVFRDSLVQNGFVYFYSATGKDSNDIGPCSPKKCLEGRRSAVEAEGVTPQIGTRKGKSVWVVPNPYRARAQWDLTPSASDPTGTHIDFLGMPPGKWTLRIYTVSGDLVQELHSGDPINESIRVPVTDPVTGEVRPGYNTQQDTANDGQARWNLITRSGQDVVSGIYLFTVQSSEGTQRGRFVIIR